MQIALVATRPDGHLFLRQDVDLQPGPASPVTQDFSTAKRAYFVSGGAGLSGYIAELCAAFVGAVIGLPPDHLEDHASYIESWLRVLRDQPSAFLSAAGKAQSAANYLLHLMGERPASDPPLEREPSRGALDAADCAA
jgi:hypothetical protein